MANRRETLKILGAIGSTCAFPFTADELYGQEAANPAGRPGKFFTGAEMARLAVLSDLIIPATQTAGSSGAGVPAYIDLVASGNEQEGKLLRQGIAWLESAQGFFDSGEEEKIAALRRLCEAADDGKFDVPGARFFFTLKSLTADGYYTSKIGLIEELGYKGNTAMAEYPECREH
jgi:gluconate 2-dehydrogenase gamma chain